MVKKFGKKVLLLLTLILAIVVTTLGVATAESTIEELQLETDSEVVVFRTETVAGNENTIGTTFTPIVKAKINGEWVYLNNEDIEWSCSLETDGSVPGLNPNGDLIPRGSWGYPCGKNVNTITGTYQGLTVTYSARLAVPISTKEDMEALADRRYTTGIPDIEGTQWTYNFYYALTNDIDYSNTVWTERYLKPIANIGVMGGIRGIYENFSNSAYQRFGATFDGRGYTIKNAVLPLGSSFNNDAHTGISPYGQNFIGYLYGGTLKNLKFEGLVFENRDQAIASPAYTVADNPDLSWLADTNTDGKDDTTGIPVISNSGVVSAIDMSTIATRKVGDAQFNVTKGHMVGIVGNMLNGVVDNVYVDCDMHTSAGHYDASDSPKKGGAVLVSIVNVDATAGDVLTVKPSKISNCIINARLKDTTVLQHSAYAMRGPAAILGYNGNEHNNRPDLVENCAILVENGSNFTYTSTQYYGLNAYRYYYNMTAYDTNGLKNVKVFKATASQTAFDQFLADSDFKLDMFDGLWNMAEIKTTVFKGTYESADDSVVIFGNVDTSLFGDEVEEIGVRVIRNGEDYLDQSEGDVKDGDLYEFTFEKELRADGAFGIALQDLANGDYRAYVYVKLTDGTEVVSDLITFNQAK